MLERPAFRQRAAYPGGVLLSTLAVALAACASPGVPDALRPDPAESLALVLSAEGVQVYECRPGHEPSAGWTFVAPEAELFERGRPVGRHGAGPFWQLADGSRIVGTPKQRAEAPDPRAIPWLLLGARSTGAKGVLSGVTSVQRIHTAGGTAPSSGCDAASAGSTTRVPYVAQYRFFKVRH
ncbi:MAG TPA: DUF3455 domain-containing protein [Caldimonas sp.]|jgi:hypothetical protein|nr:DUF3455 domain-containing protein [Caldimonas sp.]HEX2541334.1 DUF3455 domain-containing protein [Caldimonas sp.]